MISVDDLWGELSEDDRNRANRMTTESVQVMAAGLAHVFRGDMEAANEVFAQLSPEPADQALNAHAFAVAVVRYCASRLDSDPIEILEDMATRAALLREEIGDEQDPPEP